MITAYGDLCNAPQSFRLSADPLHLYRGGTEGDLVARIAVAQLAICIIAPGPDRTIRLQRDGKVGPRLHSGNSNVVRILYDHLELAHIDGTVLFLDRDRAGRIHHSRLRGNKISIVVGAAQINMILCQLHRPVLDNVFSLACIVQMAVARVSRLKIYIIGIAAVAFAEVESNVVVPVDPFLIYTDKLLIRNGQGLRQLFLPKRLLHIRRQMGVPILAGLVRIVKLPRDAGIPLGQDRFHSSIASGLVGIDPYLIKYELFCIPASGQVGNADALAVCHALIANKTTVVTSHTPNSTVRKPEQSVFASGRHANHLAVLVRNTAQHVAVFIRRAIYLDGRGLTKAAYVFVQILALAQLKSVVVTPGVGFTILGHCGGMLEADGKLYGLSCGSGHQGLHRHIGPNHFILLSLAIAQSTVIANAPTIDPGHFVALHRDHLGMALKIFLYEFRIFRVIIVIFFGYRLSARSDLYRIAQDPSHTDLGGIADIGGVCSYPTAQLAAPVFAPGIDPTVSRQSDGKGAARRDLDNVCQISAIIGKGIYIGNSS